MPRGRDERLCTGREICLVVLKLFSVSRIISESRAAPF